MKVQIFVAAALFAGAISVSVAQASTNCGEHPIGSVKITHDCGALHQKWQCRYQWMKVGNTGTCKWQIPTCCHCVVIWVPAGVCP